MKPISHPALADITVEGLLYALSDPVRVRIFAEITRAQCTKICSDFIECDDRTLPKSTLSQHFKILREAGLIHSERKGVTMVNTSRCIELEKRFGGMLEAIIQAYTDQHKKNKSKKKRR